MQLLRTAPRLSVALLITVGAAACSPDRAPTSAPAAPAASPIGSLTETVDTATALGLQAGPILSCPTTQSYSARQVVGPDGGTVLIGPHKLTIPAKALTSTITVEAEAPAGQYVAVEFKPAGQRFERPVDLTLSYAHCGLLNRILLRVVYVDDAAGGLNVLEVLPSLNRFKEKTVTGKTNHFSKYMLAE
jgi:hypothetical protein